jgi:outer membrane protein assembly factor BamD
MRHSLALILLLSLIACSSHPKLSDADSDAAPRPASEMYTAAKQDLKLGNYERAAKQYESLISRYPYGPYAQQAHMELAYAYYKHSEAEPALSTIDRFIKQFPTSTHLDYMYYLKGLVNFNSDMGLFNKIAPNDLSEHDPQQIQDSFNAFKELVTRFPDGKYAPDARVRMQYLVNMLARHEVNVANYYFRRGAYVAAVNRAQNVLRSYPHSPETRDALQLMAQSYDAMGMKDLGADARRVLERNTASAATVQQ